MKWPTRLRNELLVEKEKLLSFVDELSKYYNKETVDKLISIIMLETSVFEHKDFYEEFGNLDSLFEIAKYNICNHTVKIIQEKLKFDSEKLKMDYEDPYFVIQYKAVSSFDIFNCNFRRRYASFEGKILKPSITLPYYEISSQDKIRQISEEIQKLKNKEYRTGVHYDWNTSKWKSDDFTCGGPDSYQRIQDLNRVHYLEDELQKLAETGVVFDQNHEICNQVTDFLIKEWQLDNWDNSNRLDNKKDSKVKRLSWIDIYKG